jgi:hypothetical protein
VEALAVTPIDVQASLPLAVTVLLTEHVLAGEVRLAVKFAEPPGARVGTVNTVLGKDWLSTTTMLFRVTLPGLLTVPWQVINPPAAAGTSGQFSVTAMAGAVESGQVADAKLVTTVPTHASLPLAVTVLLTEHASAGAVRLAVKFAEPPGARLGTVNTVLGEDWLSTTTTLFRVTLPGLLTVPW